MVRPLYFTILSKAKQNVINNTHNDICQKLKQTQFEPTLYETLSKGNKRSSFSRQKFAVYYYATPSYENTSAKKTLRENESHYYDLHLIILTYISYDLHLIIMTYILIIMTYIS